MGAVEHRFVAAISGTPGASWMAATGHEHPGTAAYGIALLSRFPVASWQLVRLPQIPMRFPMYLPGPNRVMIVDEEPRAAVIAQLHTPLGTLTVANTHLSFVPGWNRRQLRRLMHDLRGFPGPRLLIGDLNMTRAAVRRWSGMRPLAVAATFPAETPNRQLDHPDRRRSPPQRCDGGGAYADLRPPATGRRPRPRVSVKSAMGRTNAFGTRPVMYRTEVCRGRYPDFRSR
jgi:endonuclease/exonuclease/phosphatase family metal-dependent hydrolase